MERNDVSTITVSKKGEQVYMKAIEVEWLRYLGFSEKEIDSGSIKLIVKADYAENRKVPFIGIGKADKQ